MAIVKKGKKNVEKPGFPVQFVELTERAATLSVAADFFDTKYAEARKAVEEYLTADDCPITVNVGEKGSNPKVEGIATVILSQPERLDNKAAAQKVAELFAEGKLNAGDLVELISQVNKEALSKVVDADTLNALIKRDETGEAPLQVSVRVAGEYKGQIGAFMASDVLPVVFKD